LPARRVSRAPRSRQKVLADLKTQFNVIKALTIHELQDAGKAYNYGFAWALLEPIMFIGIMRALRSALKGLTPPDMPPTTFLIVGIVPYYMYLSAMGAVYKSLSEPDKMLQFPRVTPIDVAIAASLRDFCIYFAVYCIFLVPVSIYEGAFPPENALKVFVLYLVIWMLGVSFGFVAGAAARVFPPIKQFISYYNILNRMIGGMLFVITMFPSVYWPYLTWNPTLHCMEMIRDGWFVTYTSPVADPAYVAEWILGLTLLGLSLERYQRRMPYV
jgi:capsular polysaccharide transport system permease protein